MRIVTYMLDMRLSFDITRHDLDVEPDCIADKMLAYVGFGDSFPLLQAKWVRGEWRDSNSCAFEHPPSCWYSLGMPTIEKV